MSELRIFYTVLYTEWGNLWIGSTDRGICSLLLDHVDEEKISHGIEAALGIAPQRDDEQFEALRGKLRAYLRGEKVSFDFPLDLKGVTSFQKDVWDQTRRIPYGTTISYQKLAAELGKPHRARAVGRALGSNPIPLLIPCHRVVHEDGGLGGYTGGLEWKRRLLAIEQGALRLNL
jgi:O-6-methylguanine DNA methyltransferase